MKVTITIEDQASGAVIIKTTPKVHMMQKMIAAKEATPAIAYCGFALKQLFKMTGEKRAAIMPGDSQAFVPETKKKSRLMLPGVDF